MKSIIIHLVVAVLMAAPAFAAERVGYDAQRQAHREEMKRVKAAMREERKNNPQPKGESKWSSFWKKEGERSGLGTIGANSSAASNVVRNLNPIPFFKSQEEQYKARKAAAGK